MVQTYLLLTQTVAWSVVAILALLLAAAAIGYITSWFYAKSIYTPVVKSLESDNSDLKKHVEEIKSDIRKLEEKSAELNEKISSLEQQISDKEKEIKHLRKQKKE